MSNTPIPASPGPDGNVADLLAQAALNHPDRSALLGAFGSLSWADLDRAASVGAAALADQTAAGDRVVVRLPVGPDAVLALFAAARAGLVVAPLAPDRSGEVEPTVAAVGAVGSIGAAVGGLQVSAADVASWWSAPAQSFTTRGGGEDLVWLAGAAGERPSMISHRAMLAAVAGVLGAPSLRPRAEDRAILVLPLHHLAGWVSAFLPVVPMGGALVFPDIAAPGEWIGGVLASIREHRVTVVPAAPGLYRRLTGAAGVERALSSVRLMTSAATPLDPDDLASLRTTLGQSVWEGYGISEATSVVTTTLMTGAPRVGSVGLPVAGVEIRIIGDADDDSDLTAGADQAADLLEDAPSSKAAKKTDDSKADDAEETPDDEAVVEEPPAPVQAIPTGEIGPIAVRGGTLFSGYWPDGADGPDEDGWFTTTDIGYLDDLGELHLVDRAEESFTVAGFTVYPREVEDVLTTHPYVRDAAVVAIPDRGTNKIVAVLVAQRGTRPTDDDLADHLATRLAAFKRPAAYVLVDRMPRTEVGRIDRRAVTALVDPTARVASMAPKHARGADESDADLF